MRRKLFLLLMLCFMAVRLMAQAPKWIDKAKNAVFTVVAYDKNDKIIHSGNGFFVTEDGMAVGDYSTFEGAERAVVIDAQGKQMNVGMILGANGMYDVVKFSVNITDKKVTALPLASSVPGVNSTVFLLPYSTQKDRSFGIGKVQSVDKVEGSYNYYTLNLSLKDKMVSCPLVNSEGEVFGLAQKSSGADSTTICYGIDVKFANDLQVKALSFNDNSLMNIGIKKALPDAEEDALAMLYMVSSRLTLEEYLSLLNDFIAKFPNSADGFLRRANVQLAINQDDAALQRIENDLNNALRIASGKAEVYYNKANLIYSYLGTNPEKPYKNWNIDTALAEIEKAINEDNQPVYMQLKGDMLFAKGDYKEAYTAYEAVNHSPLASAATFYNAAKTKELLNDTTAMLALMDSCIMKFNRPYVLEAAPYLLERARMRDEANLSRLALTDYDEYYNAVNTQVNDVFYYMRAETALRARVYQRALDDFAEAVELNPQEMAYRAGLAMVNLRVGRNEEALNVLNEMEKADPTYSDLYRLRGLAQLQLKQNEAACQSFNKAKELGNEDVLPLIEKYCN